MSKKTPTFLNWMTENGAQVAWSVMGDHGGRFVYRIRRRYGLFQLRGSSAELCVSDKGPFKTIDGAKAACEKSEAAIRKGK